MVLCCYKKERNLGVKQIGVEVRSIGVESKIEVGVRPIAAK